MAIPAWYWPPSGLAARGISIVPYGAGLAVPDWTTPRFFPFIPGIGFSAPKILANGGPGLSAAAPDGSGGIYVTDYGLTGGGGGNNAWHVTSGGTATPYALTPNHVYVGAAFIAPSGYLLSDDGRVWREAAAHAFNSFASWPSSASMLRVSGSTLLAYLPPSGVLGTMTTAGVTGTMALPVAPATPSCLALGSGLIAVGGWSNAPALSGAAMSVLDPQDATVMAAVGTGYALLWRTSGAFTEAWSQSQALTGLATLKAAAWRPDGTQILAASVASGAVQVLGYSAGLMTLAQTVTVTGACGVTVAAGSINALVAQSGQATAMPLTYGGGVWTTGAAVTGLTGISSIAAFGATGAVAAVSGGVAFLGLAAGVWSILQNVALGYAPSAIAVDSFLRVYAAGSGVLSVLSGATSIGSSAWAGAAPTAIAVQPGRVLLAIPSDGLVRIFGQSDPSGWTQQGSGSLSLGAAVGLGLSDTTLFACGSGATNTYGFSGAPFSIARTTSGIVSIWNGASWNSAVLGIGHNPSAASFDVSGNAWVVTHQDTIWSLSSGAAVLSSGSIPVFPGQLQTTPIGASAIAPVSGHVYVATSLAGVLVETS